MGKVRCRNPKTGVVYVYSSEGYFDEKDQKYKYRRRVIGKLDENGNEVPTGPVGRPRKTYGPSGGSIQPQGETTPEDAAYAAEKKELEEKILALQNALDRERENSLRLKKDANRMTRQILEAVDAFNKAVAKY